MTSAACPLSPTIHDLVCILVWPHQGPCFKKEVRFAKLLGSFPSWIILWFYGFINFWTLPLQFFTSIQMNSRQFNCFLYRSHLIHFGFFTQSSSLSTEILDWFSSELSKVLSSMGKTAEAHRLQSISGEGGKILQSFWKRPYQASQVLKHRTL